MVLYYIAFAICLITYTIHTQFHREEHTGKTTGRYHKNLKHLLAISWASWIAMIFLDPSIQKLDPAIQNVGTLLGTLGILMVVLSYVHIPFKDPGKLIMNGIYRLSRHPTYYGSMLIVIGIPMVSGSVYTLYTSVIWIGFMIYWTIQEERYLEKRYGKAFKKYKKETLI